MSHHEILRTRFGSHVYGTNLPTSDTDIKAIYLPAVPDLLLQRARGVISSTTKADAAAKNTAEDVDIEQYALHKYFDLLLQGNTVAMDILFTPKEFWERKIAPTWERVVKSKDIFLHKGTASFAGYCRTQANRYGIKGSRVAAARAALELLKTFEPRKKLGDYEAQIFPFVDGRDHCGVVLINNPKGQPERFLEVCNRKFAFAANVKHALDIVQRIFDEYGKRALQAESNDGCDWKALAHAVRVANQAQELLLTGHITFPRPEAELLRSVRKGERPYREVAAMIERGLEDLEVAKTNSTLPEEPNRKAADDLLYEIYEEHVWFGLQAERWERFKLSGK
jgi:hypothetical protein